MVGPQLCEHETDKMGVGEDLSSEAVLPTNKHSIDEGKMNPPAGEHYTSEHKSLILSSFPNSSGAHNGFLGKIQDAGEIGMTAVYPIALHSFLKRHGASYGQQASRIVVRQAALFAPTLLAFGLLSALKIDYRQYRLSYVPPLVHPRDCPQVQESDFRSADVAEKCNRDEFVFGAIAGMTIRKTIPGLLYRTPAWMI